MWRNAHGGGRGQFPGRWSRNWKKGLGEGRSRRPARASSMSQNRGLAASPFAPGCACRSGTFARSARCGRADHLLLDMLVRIIEANDSYARPGNGRRKPQRKSSQ